MKKVEKLVKAFKLSGLTESEKIELDNLDWARLVYNENKEVVVENEHGTQFGVDELSDMELEIFLANIVINKQYGSFGSAMRYIRNYEKKHGKQLFVINQLDSDCFEVINYKK